MTSDELRQWANFWTTDKEDYLLITDEDPASASASDCIINNVVEGSILRIEDNEFARELISRMIIAGVPIVPVSSAILGTSDVEVLTSRLLKEGASGAEIKKAVEAFERENGAK